MLDIRRPDLVHIVQLCPDWVNAAQSESRIDNWVWPAPTPGSDFSYRYLLSKWPEQNKWAGKWQGALDSIGSLANVLICYLNPFSEVVV